jgi:ABC-2 type transport system permease protein
MEPMANKLWKHLKLYWYLVKFSAMLETEYRFSFVLKILVEITFFSATLTSFSVLFANVSQIVGWNKYEIMVLYGLNMVFSETLLGIAFIFNLRDLPNKIVKGDLDLILVKPVNALFAATLWRPYFASLPSLMAGIVVMMLGFSLGHLPFNLINLFPFALIFLCGLVIAYSLGVIISCLSFWFMNAEPLPYLAQQFIFLAVRPYEIFGGIWRYIFLLIIPIAFMVSFPAKTLMGQFEWWWIFSGIIITIIFVYLCRLIWRKGLLIYESASS